MSLNNLLFLNIFILLELFFLVKGEIIINEVDCSELEKINKELLLKIEELKKRNEDLEEELKKYKRKEEEEEEKVDENEIGIYNNLDSLIIENFEEFNLLYERLKKKWPYN